MLFFKKNDLLIIIVNNLNEHNSLNVGSKVSVSVKLYLRFLEDCNQGVVEFLGGGLLPLSLIILLSIHT